MIAKVTGQVEITTGAGLETHIATDVFSLATAIIAYWP
jgi:hypothetical protein